MKVRLILTEQAQRDLDTALQLAMQTAEHPERYRRLRSQLTRQCHTAQVVEKRRASPRQ